MTLLKSILKGFLEKIKNDEWDDWKYFSALDTIASVAHHEDELLLVISQALSEIQE